MSLQRVITVSSEKIFRVSMAGREQVLTQAEARQLLGELQQLLLTHCTEPVRSVLMLVADEFHIPATQLLEDSKLDAVTKPRQAAMWLCRKVLGLKFAEIARALDMHHGTVMHGTSAIQDLIDTNRIWFGRMGRLKLVVEDRLLGKTEEAA